MRSIEKLHLIVKYAMRVIRKLMYKVNVVWNAVY